jgi:hypothetical protein
MSDVITGGWRYLAWLYGWKIRYYIRLPWAYMREVYYYFTGRPKGTVLKVGTVEAEEGGGWQMSGWHFDATDCIAGLEVSVTGMVYVAGYAIEELRVLASSLGGKE